jgi:hypothetical protein
MRKTNFIKVFFALVLALGLYGTIFPSQKSEAASSSKAIVTSHYYKGIKSLKYPQVSGLKSRTVQNKINEIFITAVKKSYSAYVQTMNQEKIDKAKGYCSGQMCKYEQISSYQIKYNTNGLLSILYHNYNYSGGAHGNDYVDAYAFSLTSGHQYQINDILKKSSNYTKVKNYAYQYLSTHKPYKEFLLVSKSEFSVNKKTQFYFTSGGIYLIFQEYEVCAYAAGQPIVKIPSYVYR